MTRFAPLALLVLAMTALAALAPPSIRPALASESFAHVLYYDEPGAAMTVAEALARPELFSPDRPHRPPMATGMRWLRVAVANDGETVARQILALGLPDIETLDARLVVGGLGGGSGGGRIVPLLTLDRDSPFSARPLPVRELAVPIDLPPGTRGEVMLRYHAHGHTQLDPRLMTPDAFHASLADGNLVNGLVAGVLLALSLLALAQWTVLRRAEFLAYGALSLLMIAFIAQIEGYTFPLLWPDQGGWNQTAPFVLVVAVQAAHALFTLAVFDLGRRSWFRRAYIGYLGLLLVGAAHFLATGRPEGALLVALAYAPLSIAAGLSQARRGVPVAGFFLAGTLGYVLFNNILFGWSVLGYGDGVDPFVYPRIGYVVEALFFALALARQTLSLHQRVEEGLLVRLAEAQRLVEVEAERGRALLAAQERRMRLAAASHDLRQPLVAIRYALSAIGERDGDDTVARHIHRSLDHSESLLRDLLDEARREGAGPPAALPLGSVLAAAHDRHRAAAAAKGLDLRVQPTLHHVMASELVLTRILDNLLGNAIRYTERGGVLLGVRRRAEGVEIQVVDSGPGFDARRRDALLAPFVQSGTLAREREGWGLGLHIVRTLCAHSGFHLRVRSTPGRGSLFGVLIPHAPDLDDEL